MALVYHKCGSKYTNTCIRIKPAERVKDGVYTDISNDNRRNYTNNNATTVNVDKLVVQDKQDMRALAQEIGVVQRRAALGMGG